FCFICFLCFFFQAEDGIRDRNVTGVQTCALPICLIGGCIGVLEFAKGTIIWPDSSYWKDSILFFETSEEKPEPELITRWLRNYRSEERRVGKECRSRGGPEDEKEEKYDTWNRES